MFSLKKIQAGAAATALSSSLLASCAHSPANLLTDFNGTPEALPTHDIVLTGRIDPESEREIIGQLNEIDTNSHVRLVLRDSPGGIIESGLNIYRALRDFKKVDTVCDGHIASMAALLFAMNEKGARIATENCTDLMFHSAFWMLTDPVVKSYHVNALYKANEIREEIITKALNRATGLREENIAALFTRSDGNCYLLPRQAAQLGIVTHFSTQAQMTARAPSHDYIQPDNIYQMCKTNAPSQIDSTELSPRQFGL